MTGLFYSNNGGTTFAQTVTPNVNPGGQAPVNLVLAIDPTSTNLIYVAGDNRFTLNGGFNSLAIERVNTTTNHLHGDGRRREHSGQHRERVKPSTRTAARSSSTHPAAC